MVFYFSSLFIIETFTSFKHQTRHPSSQEEIIRDPYRKKMQRIITVCKFFYSHVLFSLAAFSTFTWTMSTFQKAVSKSKAYRWVRKLCFIFSILAELTAHGFNCPLVNTLSSLLLSPLSISTPSRERMKCAAMYSRALLEIFRTLSRCEYSRDRHLPTSRMKSDVRRTSLLWVGCSPVFHFRVPPTVLYSLSRYFTMIFWWSYAPSSQFLYKCLQHCLLFKEIRALRKQVFQTSITVNNSSHCFPLTV